MIVERHGFCPQCGYVIEQAYSPIVECFYDIKKGHKCPNGTYIQKILVSIKGIVGEVR